MGLMSFRFARFAILAACLLTLNVDSSNFLPQGWTAHSSEGVPYYYNQNTGITQWEKPVLPSQGYSNYQPSSDQRGFNKGASGSTTTSKTYHNQRVDTTRYSSQQSQPHNQQNYGSGSVSINHNSAVSAGIPNTSTEFTQGRHNSSQTQQNVNISQLQSDEEDAVTVKQPSLVDSKENGVESTIIYNNDRINNSGSASNNLNTDEQLKREITSSNVMINSTNSSIMMGDYDSNAASINNRGQQIPANENANSVRSSEIQTFITQLKDADQKIDELNDVIDVLENEKFELQNLIEICEEIQRNITLISVAAVRNASEVHSASQLQLTNQLTAVELELEILADELELLKTAQSKLESNLVFEKEKNVKSSEILIDLQSNFTIKNEELQEKEERSKDQEKELSNVYKELAQLEEDFKNIAEPSLRRSRRPSFFKRILLQAFPVWIGGKGSVKNVRRAKGKIAAVTASEESLVAINNTIKDLRVSLKEMSVALGEKDVTIEEISEKLAEHIDEDKKRCGAHATLREGVENLNEENEKLLKALELRDEEISQILLTIEENILDAEKLQKNLDTVEQNIKTEVEKCLLDRNTNTLSLQALQGELERNSIIYDEKNSVVDSLCSSIEKAVTIENEIKHEISSVAAHLNDLQRCQQAEAKRIVEMSLLDTKNKPWFLCFWPF